MTLHYDDNANTVTDDASGIAIMQRSAPGLERQLLFRYKDPKSSLVVPSIGRSGEIDFLASPIDGPKSLPQPDGSFRAGQGQLGYELDVRQLQRAFANYTGRDPAKFALVCEFIGAALKLFFRRWDHITEPVIVFK